MADHSDLSTSENYAALLQTRITGRLKDLAAAMDPAYVAPTNVPVNTVRFSSAAKKWQRWNGTAWVDAAASYAISIDGNAATATVAAAVVNGVYTTGNQTVGGNKTFTGNTVVEVNSADTALRVTQTGAGNALVVEDEASPDSSPFVVTGIGVVVAGATAASSPVSGGALLQTNGSGNGGATVGAFQWSSGATSALGGQLALVRSKSGIVGTHTSVISGDALGSVLFEGSDGTNFVRGAAIQTFVDGAPGAGAMPGRLMFSTTPSGSSTPVERMRIDSSGQITIGGTPSAGVNVYARKDITGATTAYGIAHNATVRSDVTGSALFFNSTYSTEAAGFTLTNLTHYTAGQGTIGAGSSVTNQYGFSAASTLTGAANNYGFYSNIAASTGRWNFYANGTAPNYFAGTVSSLGSYNATTASAANVNISSAGLFARSTSSIRYKRDVETLESARADAVVRQARPVWYRSKCESDPADWGYYGLIAEELAEIDARLVHWGRPTKPVTVTIHHEAEIVHHDAEIVHHEAVARLVPASTTLGEDGQPLEPARLEVVREAWDEVVREAYDEVVREAYDELIETVAEDTDAPLQPEGVQYDRLTVMLLDVVRRQQQAIETLQARVDALKAQP